MRTYKAGSKELDDLGLPYIAPAKVKSSLEPTCSFCGKDVDESRVTRGIGKPRKIITKTYKENFKTGEIEMEERIVHTSDKVVACPDCCLLIKPIYRRCRTCKGKTKTEIANCPDCHGTKEGEMLSQGTIFPDFD